jgi:alkanesulfonate monooxygenase SsuD/methylene tetrahydromethanopterin reductase-like flavin-dependent oxidoreductase (luciferase family)
MAWFGRPDERLTKLRFDLREICERVGRDPATLLDTVGVIVSFPDWMWPTFEPTTPALSGTPAEIADGLAAHAAEGADQLIVVLEPCTPATLGELSLAVERYRSGVVA